MNILREQITKMLKIKYSLRPMM